MRPFTGWWSRLGAEWGEFTNFRINGTTVTATAAQINGAASGSRPVAASGSTKALVAADASSVQQLDTLTGSVVTLPAATGSGRVYEFVTTVVPTSNSHIVKVANASDFMNGALVVVNDATGACTPFGSTGTAGTRSDTITLNRTTTGGVAVGERFFLKDIAANNWALSGTVIGTGTIATPLSATV